MRLDLLWDFKVSLRLSSEDVSEANRYAGLELREEVWARDVDL